MDLRCQFLWSMSISMARLYSTIYHPNRSSQQQYNFLIGPLPQPDPTRPFNLPLFPFGVKRICAILKPVKATRIETLSG